MKYKLNKSWLNTKIESSCSDSLKYYYDVNGNKYRSIINGNYYYYTYQSNKIHLCLDDNGVILYKNEYTDDGNILSIDMRDYLITYSYVNGLVDEVIDNTRLGKFVYVNDLIDKCIYDDGDVDYYEYDDNNNKISMCNMYKEVSFTWQQFNILKY